MKEEGGRSCPDSIVEGGAENVQGREKGGRGEEREREEIERSRASS